MLVWLGETGPVSLVILLSDDMFRPVPAGFIFSMLMSIIEKKCLREIE